ncbi:MAG: DNA recombination/repair protein RecA [Mycoplasma sp.]|nr:DNA recombination/repair protein RecA [Mycoplasma sp.]
MKTEKIKKLIIDELDKKNVCDLDVTNKKEKFYKTGSIVLDNLLMNTGYPQGKIIEIYGPESSGKTTLALQAVAEMTQNKKYVIYFDLENSLNWEYAKNLKIDKEYFILCRLNSGEEVFDLIIKLIQLNCVALIVVDSVAALIANTELNEKIENNNIGLHARLISKGIKLINNYLLNSETSIIFVNQLRAKISNFIGPQETTTGGVALKYFASTRIEIRKVQTLLQENKPYGNVIKIKIVKNKNGIPFLTGNTELIFGQGILLENEIANLAIDKKIIEKNGIWYKWNNENIAKGKKNLISYLQENQPAFDQIKEVVFQSNNI